MQTSEFCARARRALRHGLDFESTTTDVLAQLHPELVTDRMTFEWAGTVAFDQARVVEYKVTPYSIDILRKSDGILSWIYPRLPEDLAFFGKDGRCPFNSLSHHEEIWLCDRELIDYMLQFEDMIIEESVFSVPSLTHSDRTRK